MKATTIPEALRGEPEFADLLARRAQLEEMRRLRQHAPILRQCLGERLSACDAERDELERRLREVEAKRAELGRVDDQLVRLAPPPSAEEVPWHLPGSDVRRKQEADAAWEANARWVAAELGRPLDAPRPPWRRR